MEYIYGFRFKFINPVIENVYFIKLMIEVFEIIFKRYIEYVNTFKLIPRYRI